MSFNNYPQVCFDYIHQNPVKAKLVIKPEKWLFSSCKQYMDKDVNAIICWERIKEFQLE